MSDSLSLTSPILSRLWKRRRLVLVKKVINEHFIIGLVNEFYTGVLTHFCSPNTSEDSNPAATACSLVVTSDSA